VVRPAPSLLARASGALLLLLAPLPLFGQRAAYTAGWRDVAITGGSGLLAVLPVALRLPHGAPPCAPCDPAGLWGIDRVAVHPVDAGAARASDLLLAGVAGSAALASVLGVPASRARGNVAVMADAVSLTGAATEWVKALVHRSRPVLYTADAVAAAGSHENRVSFPSGHTSFAFAAATSYAVLAGRQHLPHATRNSVLLFLGAAGVGSLRVAAHRHFPTDVAAGAALGAGIGWLVAAVHPTVRAP
jgi:membrane-associated phospholipid phosphatase